mmetsp:Transcript_70739/g.182394  ORF Transcript_70739/g.182394 Transcript_70739/m.182394 type:complete len:307 (-) Transcript_70739:133-1053(-)
MACCAQRRSSCAMLLAVCVLSQQAILGTAVMHRMHDFGIAARQVKARDASAALSVDIGEESDTSCLLQVDNAVVKRSGAATTHVAPAAVQAEAVLLQAKEKNKALELAEHVEAALHGAMKTTEAVEATPGTTPRAALSAVATNSSAVAEKQEDQAASKQPLKRHTTLLLIELFPFAAFLGLDRLYLGNIGLGIAKLIVCICTFGIGGLVWGSIDLIAITMNAMQGKESINTLGMHATFEEGHSDRSYAIAVLDLVMVPCWIALAWGVRSWRQRQRLETLRLAGMKSSHYGAGASAAAAKTGLTHGG